MNADLKFKLDHELKGSVRRLDLIYEYLRQWVRDDESPLDKARVMQDFDQCLEDTIINWQRMKRFINNANVSNGQVQD